MGAFDHFNKTLADTLLRVLGPEETRRLAALHAARSVKTDADVGDLVALSHFILTGSGEFPTQEELQRLEVRTFSGEYVVGGPEYPRQSGDATILGPEIFANMDAPYDDGVIVCWRGRNFVPQRLPEPEAEQTAQDIIADITDQIGQPVDLPDLSEAEPAPSEGEGWRGRRG